MSDFTRAHGRGICIGHPAGHAQRVDQRQPAHRRDVLRQRADQLRVQRRRHLQNCHRSRTPGSLPASEHGDDSVDYELRCGAVATVGSDEQGPEQLGPTRIVGDAPLAAADDAAPCASCLWATACGSMTKS